MAHTFGSSIWEEMQADPLNLKPVGLHSEFPGNPGLHRETKKKQTKKKNQPTKTNNNKKPNKNPNYSCSPSR